MLLNLKIVQQENDNIAEKKIEDNLKSIAKNKIGRNEPCPCNSGKKYKHCHGSM